MDLSVEPQLIATCLQETMLLKLETTMVAHLLPWLQLEADQVRLDVNVNTDDAACGAANGRIIIGTVTGGTGPI
jgi:hypothetical protein